MTASARKNRLYYGDNEAPAGAGLDDSIRLLILFEHLTDSCIEFDGGL